MPQIDGVKQSVTQKIIELLKASLGDTFKEYFEGDPILFGQAMLPGIVVTETGTSYDTGPTGFDKIIHTILVQVVFNKKDEFGKPANEATLENTIDMIVQGRDPDDGDFLPGSLIGVFRRNFTLDNLMVGNVTSVKKGVVARPEEQMTVEAHVELTLEEMQQVANRT